MSNKVIVVGGGAAGMMAAIVARRNGAEVTILERNDRVGRKILATGNGRCNYTNINLSASNYHGKNPKFVYSALSSFDLYQTLDFFERLGITPAIEDDGRVFPLSFQSSSVLDVLRYEIKDLGVRLITEAQVVDIKKKKDFLVSLKDGRQFRSDKLILATGGKAMPTSGSDGNGYNLARKLGHSITEIFPGLVQLKLDGDLFKQMKGVRFVGKASLYTNDNFLLADKGDILFTDYGISGPPILQLSRTALDCLNKGERVSLKIAVIHTMDKDDLDKYLIQRFKYMPSKPISQALIGLINKRLILPILKELNINKDKNVANISRAHINKLSKLLTSWEFRVIGSKPWQFAQVTAGGVNTDEVDNRTMESKKVEGLYIVGELLDIDGDCGGFNLQWAWSSGYVAGTSAAL